MISVILVDDHVIMRDGLRQLLEVESDIEVVGEADNGRDAVKLALQKKPNIVIMDIAMSDMNGIEATRQINRGNPNIKIITGVRNPVEFSLSLYRQFSTYSITMPPFEEYLKKRPGKSCRYKKLSIGPYKNS